jgi:hypothetical protein
MPTGIGRRREEEILRSMAKRLGLSSEKKMSRSADLDEVTKEVVYFKDDVESSRCQISDIEDTELRHYWYRMAGLNPILEDAYHEVGDLPE